MVTFPTTSLSTAQPDHSANTLRTLKPSISNTMRIHDQLTWQCSKNVAVYRCRFISIFYTDRLWALRPFMKLLMAVTNVSKNFTGNCGTATMGLFQTSMSVTDSLDLK